MHYLTAYGALIGIAHLAKGDFVVIPAASSSVGIAAREIAKDEGAMSIAATCRSNKKAELLALGADHVIAIEEEDIVARVKEITGGKGARVVFDPVAGAFLEKLAEAAALGGIIFEYGLLSMQPVPIPLLAALGKGLNVRGYSLMEITLQSGEADDSEEICFRQAGRRTFPSEGGEVISVRADRGGLQISRIKRISGEGRNSVP
jgi:NADPH:quinone reductase-like Zn-dependent oxidoreductase